MEDTHVLDINTRAAVRVDLVKAQSHEHVAKLYKRKAELERELEQVDRDIWKTEGAVESFALVEKFFEEIAASGSREFAERRAKEKAQEKKQES